jgi:arabinose-5-phosphate isomerase
VNYLDVVKNVLILEADAIIEASKRLKGQDIQNVISIFSELLENRGQLIFSGVGKSGYIGRKMASTFSSLGLRSFFSHPVEALHGDLGRVKENDAIILISKSGTTEEILKLMPFLPIPKKRIIGLLGEVFSPIGDRCDVIFDCWVEKEACLNNQAPTTSSSLALAMGDALAVLYEKMVGLSKEGFAINHPGGILGKSLRMKVGDLMVDSSDCPRCMEETSLQDVILAMTKKPVGACAIIDKKKNLKGIVVDGDIRRAFTGDKNILKAPIGEIMTSSPITISSVDLANKALFLMENRESQITILPVIDKDDQFMGFLRLHDLLKEGFSLGN